LRSWFLESLEYLRPEDPRSCNRYMLAMAEALYTVVEVSGKCIAGCESAVMQWESEAQLMGPFQSGDQRNVNAAAAIELPSPHNNINRLSQLRATNINNSTTYLHFPSLRRLRIVIVCYSRSRPYRGLAFRSHCRALAIAWNQRKASACPGHQYDPRRLLGLRKTARSAIDLALLKRHATASRRDDWRVGL